MLLGVDQPCTIELRDRKAYAPDGRSVSLQDIALDSLHWQEQEQIMGTSSYVSPDCPPPFAAQFAEIEVDTDRVGGPSAGLALTLSIIDVLTEGELTGGLQVATTGTIGVDGSVGPIGGIEQKAHAVLRAGMDVFLVPVGGEAVVRGVVGDDVAVFEVATLEEAIDALGSLGGETDDLALPPSVLAAA